MFRLNPRGRWMLPLYLAMFVAPAFAQDRVTGDSTISDWTAIRETILANNPDLQAARLETEALSNRRLQATALPDPRIMVTYQPYPLFTARGTQRSQWRVEQAIPFPGKLQLKGDIADYSAQIAASEADVYSQDLLLEGRRAYIELHRVQRQEALIAAFQLRLIDFEEGAASQYEVGAGTQQAILKAQLERNTFRQRLLALNVQKGTALETLSRLMHRELDPSQIGQLDIVESVLDDSDVDALVDLALAHRAEVEALETAGRRADAQIALAEKAFLPDFGVNLTYFDVGTASIPASATGRDALAIGVAMNIPLWRSKLKAQLDEARIRKSQTDERIQALYNRFETHIRDHVSQLTLDHQQLALYREVLVPQAETALQATLSSYTTGRTDFLDLLDAERMLFSLQTTYEDLRAKYLNASASLERTLGIESLNILQQQ